MYSKKNLSEAARRGSDCQKALLRLRRAVSVTGTRTQMNELGYILWHLEEALFLTESLIGDRSPEISVHERECEEFLDSLSRSLSSRISPMEKASIMEAVGHVRNALSHIRTYAAEGEAME